MRKKNHKTTLDSSFDLFSDHSELNITDTPSIEKISEIEADNTAKVIYLHEYKRKSIIDFVLNHTPSF